MGNLSNYYKNSVISWKKLAELDFSIVKKHFDLLELVKSTAYETEQVMGYLKHQQDKWIVLQEGHPWHEIAKYGADTLLRNQVGRFTCLVHLESRWMLIVEEGGDLVPAIFLFTEHSRDGLAVSFYRIFGGVALSPLWMKEMKKLVWGVLEYQLNKEPEHITEEVYEGIQRIQWI